MKNNKSKTEAMAAWYEKNKSEPGQYDDYVAWFEAIKICSRLITELIQAETETEDDSDEREQIVAGKCQLLRVRRYLQSA